MKAIGIMRWVGCFYTHLKHWLFSTISYEMLVSKNWKGICCLKFCVSSENICQIFWHQLEIYLSSNCFQAKFQLNESDWVHNQLISCILIVVPVPAQWIWIFPSSIIYSPNGPYGVTGLGYLFHWAAAPSQLWKYDVPRLISDASNLRFRFAFGSICSRSPIQIYRTCIAKP
jgi:hypothetical protein